jgi:hypothetical protein
MTRQVVDVSARSRIFREQPLLSHAWVATPAEVLEFLKHPRPELKKLGIRLPSDCQVETILQNHDWLAGRSHGLTDEERITVFARGEGDGKRFYRVTLYASKKRRAPSDQPLLHRPDEERRRSRPIPEARRKAADATRRSMIAAPLHRVVEEWIAPLSIDPPMTKSAEEAHRIFTGVLADAQRLVAEDPKMEATVADMASHLQKPFNQFYTNQYRTVQHPDVPFHRAFAALMYARALWWMRTAPEQHEQFVADIGTFTDDPAPKIRVLSEAVESLDYDFAAHATVAAAIRRREDHFLHGRLLEAEQLFETLNPGERDETSPWWQYARGLERFEPSNRSEWWYLPGLLAFAIATWTVRRGLGGESPSQYGSDDYE